MLVPCGILHENYRGLCFFPTERIKSVQIFCYAFGFFYNHCNEWAKVAKENGCEIMYHLCGDHRLVLKQGLVDKLRNVGLLHIASEVDIKDVVERFGDKYLIAGNMSIESYRFGTPMDAYNEAKRQVEISKECEKGFWLLAECDYAVDTPPGHAYAISKAVQDHGRFK